MTEDGERIELPLDSSIDPEVFEKLPPALQYQASLRNHLLRFTKVLGLQVCILAVSVASCALRNLQTLLQIRDAWAEASRFRAIQAKKTPALFSNVQLEGYIRAIRTNKVRRLSRSAISDASALLSLCLRRCCLVSVRSLTFACVLRKSKLSRRKWRSCSSAKSAKCKKCS